MLQTELSELMKEHHYTDGGMKKRLNVGYINSLAVYKVLHVFFSVHYRKTFYLSTSLLYLY